MSTARVLCSVTLNCELYDAADGPDGRLANEAISLAITLANAANAGLVAAQKLNADPCDYESEQGATRKRTFFVLRNVVPLSYSISYNTFRKADEFECTIPLSYLPVPPEAIRSIVAYVVLRHVTADEWQAGLDQGTGAAPQLAPDLSNADFAGICSEVKGNVGPGEIPTIKLPFRDFLGLLAQHKVEPGKGIDREMVLSASLADFLRGTPAEGLCVTWVDTEKEPTVSEHIPKAQKKKPTGPTKSGKPRTPAPLKSMGSYLDAITEECARLGCVARVNVNRVELSYAGPLYEGRLPKNTATIVASQVIESVSWEHKLVGVKTQSIQLVGHNPDTGESVTARWPPDPKSVGAVVVDPGKPPRLPPLMANVGLPGYEQLDESVLLVPVGPIGSKDTLLKMAQAAFLQRTNQRISIELKTHCPWSDPSDPDAQGGDLLRLRAGDRVTFGYLAPGQTEEDVLLPPAVLALTGELGEGSLRTVLVSAGVAEDSASTIAALLTRVPRFSTFRVDDVHVSGGSTQDAEIMIRLANFTQITSDLQEPSPIAAVLAVASQLGELLVADVKTATAALADAYRQLYLGAAEEEAVASGVAALDDLSGKVLGNR